MRVVYTERSLPNVERLPIRRLGASIVSLGPVKMAEVVVKLAEIRMTRPLVDFPEFKFALVIRLSFVEESLLSEGVGNVVKRRGDLGPRGSGLRVEVCQGVGGPFAGTPVVSLEGVHHRETVTRARDLEVMGAESRLLESESTAEELFGLLVFSQLPVEVTNFS